ncbi:hypothetical protein EDD11_004323 [Mortierella claussenii]|nr:hypothetical protein EDD11_004323 [Mortierella claussenii]
MVVRKAHIDMPEIRALLTETLDTTSMVACSQVSKAWHQEFTPHVWHTVDLMTQPDFKNLEQEIISKNGHHIRILRCIKRRSEMDMFLDPSVKNLEGFTVRLKIKRGYQRGAIDIIRRNMQTLIQLDFFVESAFDGYADFEAMHGLPVEIGGMAEAWRKTAALGRNVFEMPNLTELAIQRLQMSRTVFSMLIRGCPQLEDVHIRYCRIYSEDEVAKRVKTGKAEVDETGDTKVDVGVATTEGESETKSGSKGKEGEYPELIYQHAGAANLWASVEQVFNPEVLDEPPFGSSLLVHFPNLKSWQVWSSKNTLGDPTPQAIKAEVLKRCPQMDDYSTDDPATSIVQELFVNGSHNLKTAYFQYRTLHPSVTLGILIHKATLKSLGTYCPEEAEWSYHANQIFDVDDSYVDGWMIPLMMSQCPNLTSVRFPSHEMDMDVIDQLPWVCKDLAELRIRVKGVDTKELIMSAVSKWACGAYERRRTKKRRQTDSVEDEDAISKEDTKTAIDANLDSHHDVVNMTDSGIEDSGRSYGSIGEASPIVDRLVKHLLQFDKLTELWLGYHVWTL